MYAASGVQFHSLILSSGQALSPPLEAGTCGALLKTSANFVFFVFSNFRCCTGLWSWLKLTKEWVHVCADLCRLVQLLKLPEVHKICWWSIWYPLVICMDFETHTGYGHGYGSLFRDPLQTCTSEVGIGGSEVEFKPSHHQATHLYSRWFIKDNDITIPPLHQLHRFPIHVPFFQHSDQSKSLIYTLTITDYDDGDTSSQWKYTQSMVGQYLKMIVIHFDLTDIDWMLTSTATYANSSAVPLCYPAMMVMATPHTQPTWQLCYPTGWRQRQRLWGQLLLWLWVKMTCASMSHVAAAMLLLSAVPWWQHSSSPPFSLTLHEPNPPQQGHPDEHCRLWSVFVASLWTPNQSHWPTATTYLSAKWHRKWKQWLELWMVHWDVHNSMQHARGVEQLPIPVESTDLAILPTHTQRNPYP